MSHETRTTLEAACEESERLAVLAGTGQDRPLRNAVRAHLAAERSEAVAALERVRHAVIEVWQEAHDQHEPRVPQGWVARSLECIDDELAALRPPEAG